jgi:hypothetical protein
MPDAVLARIAQLEARVRRLESSSAPPLPQEQSGGRTPEKDIVELIGAILKQHGRRIDLGGADRKIRTHAFDEALIAIFAPTMAPQGR